MSKIRDKHKSDDFYLHTTHDKKTGKVTIQASKKGMITWLYANFISRSSYKLVEIAKVFQDKNLFLTEEQVPSVQSKVIKFIQSKSYLALSDTNKKAIDALKEALQNPQSYTLIQNSLKTKPSLGRVSNKSLKIHELEPPAIGQDILTKIQSAVAHQLKHDVTLEPVQMGLTTGLGGRPVYLVKDTQGKLVAALKQYDSAELLKEEHNNREELALHQGKAFSVPTILGAAKCGTTYWLLQSAAAGQPLSNYFEAAKTPNGFLQLGNALEHAAKGLAGLHKNSRVKAADCPDRTKQINDMLAEFKKGKEVALRLATFNKEYFDRVQKAPLSKMDGCIIHGDFQPGNVFLDSHGHPTLIDLDSVSVGFPAYDVAYFSMWIAVEGYRNNLSDAQIMQLRQKFEANYLEHAGISKKSIQQQLDFMRVFVCLERLPQVQPGGQFHDALGDVLARGISLLLLNELQRLQCGPLHATIINILKLMAY